jgi:hypothetical protein
MRRPNKAVKKRPADDEKAPSLLGPRPLRADGPHVIHANGVYTVDDLRRVFGLKASSVRREVRFGRLRMSKRCGRYYCLGQWLRQWLENGELKRRFDQRDTNDGFDGSNQQQDLEARRSS